MPRKSIRLVALPVVVLLSSCGGGGGGNSNPAPATPKSFSVDGTVSGHTGNVGVALTVNGAAAGNVVVAPGSSSFSFTQAANSGDTYQVSIGTPPSGEECTVTASRSGTVSGNVTGVQIYCTAWLYAHNQLRGQLNSGALAHSPMPTTPVPSLQWDTKLAQVAQTYASACVYAHNANRTTDYGALGGTGYVGENIASSTASFTEQQFFDLWAAEESAFVYEPITSTDVSNFGHYSQIIWRNTSNVGCAIANCSTFYFAVCDYAEGGNYLTQYPY